jgi:hypothetical protein
MDIRVTSTGRTFYQIDSAIGALLCEAFPASFENPNKPATPLPPTRARWWVGKNLFNGATVLNCKCDSCQRHECYAGRAEYISDFEKTLCVHADPCPEKLRQQYQTEFTGAPSLGSEFWKTALSKEPERPR